MASRPEESLRSSGLQAQPIRPSMAAASLRQSLRFVVATIPGTVSRSRLVSEMLPGWDHPDYQVSRAYG